MFFFSTQVQIKPHRGSTLPLGIMLWLTYVYTYTYMYIHPNINSPFQNYQYIHVLKFNLSPLWPHPRPQGFIIWNKFQFTLPMANYASPHIKTVLAIYVSNKNLKDFSLFIPMLKSNPLLWHHIKHQISWFKDIWIYTTWWCFCTIIKFSGQIVF